MLLKPRLAGLQQRLRLDAAVHLPATAALLGATREALRAFTTRGGGGGSGSSGEAEGARAGLEAAYAAARVDNVGSLLGDAEDELAELRYGALGRGCWAAPPTVGGPGWGALVGGLSCCGAASCCGEQASSAGGGGGGGGGSLHGPAGRHDTGRLLGGC